MANKDPAVLFYTSDFLGGVALMDMSERGQYITLLCLQRERGHITEKEAAKAVGKLSEEVRSKFLTDEDGKLYNPRMEKEIAKRDKHCSQQRDNVMKRWGKSGNTMEDTTVLPRNIPRNIPNEYQDGTKTHTTTVPLGNGNGSGGSSLSPYPCETVADEGESTRGGAEADVGKVTGAYFDLINPMPSTNCLEALLGYMDAMDADVIVHAIELAADENKRSWSYVKAILQRYSQQHIRTMGDVLADEAGRQKGGEQRGERGQGDGKSEGDWGIVYDN